ncbi:hypothetical protein TNCV_1547471 [Trichonephila clavipes]|nr:hypothetical protein TNCV_1547471 [Trichonephila clavipes]
MPPRRNKDKFPQLTKFQLGKIIVLRKGGFFYRAKGARVQRNSSTVMRVWKQWIDEKLAVEDGSLREQEDHIRVRSYAGEQCFPECVIEGYRGLTTGVWFGV